jgi:hypothetical protein
MTATNDRRPVDPPPVVELRIFDVTDSRDQRDITFTYNANFFIFTSLRVARQMAHGRVQTPAATSPPVLTGVPCSGIAYLDRPEEAGYFLFPDLSVRHEGRYKLAFSLYEETKEMADFDVDDQEPQDAQHFVFRMEIESTPFTVYSAKKFPGLSESTVLSRNLSDQGVRVRIRRDVRMRRRDAKAGGGGGGGGDAQKPENEYSQRPTRTPERQPSMDHYRQRSSSAVSDHGRGPYEVSRRPSGPEYPPAPAPPPPNSFSAARGNLNFGQEPQYPGARTSVAPSPTTPTFSPGISPLMQKPSSSHGIPSMNAESPGLPPLQHRTVASPAPSYRQQAPNILPSIHALIHSTDHITPDDNPDPPTLTIVRAGTKRRNEHMSKASPYELPREPDEARLIRNLRGGVKLDDGPLYGDSSKGGYVTKASWSQSTFIRDESTGSQRNRAPL